MKIALNIEGGVELIGKIGDRLQENKEQKVAEELRSKLDELRTQRQGEEVPTTPSAKETNLTISELYDKITSSRNPNTDPRETVIPTGIRDILECFPQQHKQSAILHIITSLENNQSTEDIKSTLELGLKIVASDQRSYVGSGVLSKDSAKPRFRIMLRKLLNREEGNKFDLMQKFVVGSVDANMFKKINDILGHATGDKLISVILNFMTKELPNIPEFRDCFECIDNELLVVPFGYGTGDEAGFGGILKDGVSSDQLSNIINTNLAKINVNDFIDPVKLISGFQEVGIKELSKYMIDKEITAEDLISELRYIISVSFGMSNLGEVFSQGISSDQSFEQIIGEIISVSEGHQKISKEEVKAKVAKSNPLMRAMSVLPR